MLFIVGFNRPTEVPIGYIIYIVPNVIMLNLFSSSHSKYKKYLFKLFASYLLSLIVIKSKLKLNSISDIGRCCKIIVIYLI